ncbi:hypothetical protein LguiA_004502 [Lonicera macranthoides]
MAIVGAQESSSSALRYNYQVFLSFRGEDTRRTFTDHLYRALLQGGLRTFRDDDEIERGKKLELELCKAIHGSRISIIVFSKNYASSKWCLDKLVMILEWSRTSRHEVLPIFYHVDPSDVRKQRGSIGEAFARYEEEFIDGERDLGMKTEWMEKLKGWKVALTEVANLTGMVLHNHADGYEAEFIQEIVRVVEDKVSCRVLHVARHPIGLHYRAESINLWVQDSSTDVKIFIICGMGGIGKTTIAKFVYNLNYQAFDSSAFVASVREKSEQPNGLVHLQQHLLSNVLKRKKEDMFNVDESIVVIEEAICCKRVLLVLDDVSEVKQLDALLGTREFYPGSKIIITTRHKWLLKAHQVHKMHNVEKLRDSDSMELFCWHAFGQDHPIDGYEELSNRVVYHCGGIPLAHEILGSSLSGKSKDIWRSALKKLEAIPDAQIIKQLKLSYESLQDEHDKNLFLHIACFFVGNEIYDTITILNNCGFCTRVGIENLVDRCLVNIDKDKKCLMMHQLIQEMGRQIVDQESPQEPGGRSRLWRHKDSIIVLKERKGMQTIEGLILDMHMVKDDDRSCFKDKNAKKRRYEEFVNEPLLSNKANSLKRRYMNFLSWQSTYMSLKSPNKVTLTTEGFARMDNLKFLQLNYVQLTGGYDNFPQSLRWLCWHGFTLKSLPMDLPTGNLVSLDLSYSKLKQVWKGTMVLGSLKILNLSYSLQLARTPNFLGLANLEKLILKGCVGLVVVCESIGSLKGLMVLNLEDCKNLRKFPYIGKLKFLETLILDGCSNMSEFQTDLKNVELVKNAVRGFKLWDAFSWPWLSKPRKSVEGFWASLPHSLVNLSLADCNLSHDSFPSDLGNIVSLQALDLSGNPLYRVPDCINKLRRVKVLRLNNCQRLQYVRVTNVEHLYMVESTSVKRIMYDQPVHSLTYTRFLDLLEHEEIFKLKHLVKVEREMLNNLGLFNMELIKNLVVRLAFPFSFRTIAGSVDYHTRDLPIQGLYELGIFSTFLPKTEAPSWCNELNKGSSISFIVPSYPNLWIQGMNVCGVYALSNRLETWFPPPIVTKITNKTKDLNWIYMPWSLGIPAEDGEELVWLSHWKFGNHMESGDEVIISIVTGDSFEVKECGFNIIWVDQEEKESTFNTGYDISSYQVKTGVYALNQHFVETDHDNHLKTPRCHSLQLARTPDFFGLLNLEKLILKGCVGLVEVCQSIGSLEGLLVLNLEDCKNLRKFPNIDNLKFLETLIIAGCSNISEFLADLKNVESLKEFKADRLAINPLLPNAARGFKLWDALYLPWLSKPRKSVESF